MTKLIKFILFQLLIIVTITSCNNENESYINPAPINNSNFTVKEQIYDLAEQYGVDESIYIEDNKNIRVLSFDELDGLNDFFYLVKQIKNNLFSIEDTDITTRSGGNDIDYWAATIKSDGGFLFNILVKWVEVDSNVEMTDIIVSLYGAASAIKYEPSGDAYRWNSKGATADFTAVGQLCYTALGVYAGVKINGWVNTFTGRGHAFAKIAR